MGFVRLVLTRHWKQPARKPTLFERVGFRDKDNQRRSWSQDEVIRITARRLGWNPFRRTPRCKVCGSTNNLQIDHIKSLKRGGVNTKFSLSPFKSKYRNLQLLCRDCNLRKGWKL